MMAALRTGGVRVLGISLKEEEEENSKESV